jgi:hypothetical protein
LRFSTCILNTAAGLALGVMLIPAARATPVNYTFLVTATSGPLSGTTASGTFSYDTSSIVVGSNGNTGLLTALNFTWNGTVYNRTTANTGTLFFDNSGHLISQVFGNNCAAGFCAVTPGQDQWYVGSSGFTYSTLGAANAYTGTAPVSLVASTPEPSTLSLLSLGLGFFAVARRRKRRRV